MELAKDCCVIRGGSRRGGAHPVELGNEIAGIGGDGLRVSRDLISAGQGGVVSSRHGVVMGCGVDGVAR